MKGFNLDMEDVTEYITNKTNFKLPDSLKMEDDTDSNATTKELHSLNAQSEKLEKHINKRLITLLIAIPLILFFMIVTYKAYILYTSSNVRYSPKIPKVEKLGLTVNSDLKWKLLKDEETTNLADNITLLKSEIKRDLNNTLFKVDKKIVQNTKMMQEQFKIVQESIKNSNELMILKLSGIGDVQDKLTKKLEMQKKELLVKIKTNTQKVIYLDSNNSKNKNMPPLPPLRKRIYSKSNQVSKKISANEQNQTITNENTNAVATNGSLKLEEKIEYESVEEIITQNSVDYSSLMTYEDKNTTQENIPMPKFKLMTGFVKGTLLNGAEVPAILDGAGESVPIYISIDSDQLIANKGTANIEGCIVLATAKGELSKHSVNLRLSSISCNIVDLDGNSYEINQKVQGWVLSENGSYDIDGRVVSREKDIIKAGLPLTIVESMVGALAAAMSGENQSFLAPTENQSILAAMGRGAGTSASKSTEKILGKFSEYYLKMIESLTPTISIRAGRKVTIAFKGGESLQMKKYDPVNISYFQDYEIENEEYEDEY